MCVVTRIQDSIGAIHPECGFSRVAFQEIFNMLEASLRTRRRAKHACLDVF